MSLTVKFRTDALKEWNALSRHIQKEFAQRIQMSIDTASIKLMGESDVYKIDLGASGFRLAYQIIDNTIIIAAVSFSGREHSELYKFMK